MKKEKVQCKHTVLFLEENKDVEKILEIHKQDRVKSRVLVKNNPERYKYREEVIFENDKNDFHVLTHNKCIRISSNNKMYFTSSNRTVYLYKNKKFWYIENGNKIVRPMTINHLNESKVYKIFLERFPWIKFLKEHQGVLHSLGFNTIIKYKLFGYKECLKYMYKTNLPTAKMYLGYTTTEFKYFQRNSINIDKTNPEFLIKDTQTNYLFKDSIRMAEVLGEKVNCLWTVKRLTQEHDAWAKKITDITMVEADRKLNVKKEYLDFAKWAGYNIITTTKELAYEGNRQSHCVGTYSSQINSGKSAIFHIEGYTAELSFNGWLSLDQFQGFKNKMAPPELRAKVMKQIDKFNDNNKYSKPKPQVYYSNDWFSENLPRHKSFKDTEGWTVEMDYISPKTNEAKTFVKTNCKSERDARIALYDFINENELFHKKEPQPQLAMPLIEIHQAEYAF